jgi:methylmalonyl-CoA/ethylmalonyl-CoA epimerase
MVKKASANPAFNKLHHVGVVVKDIKKAIAYFESMGIGPFGGPGGAQVMKLSFKGELHGKPATWTTTASIAKFGDVELEVLEPTEGPQALKESLEKTGEGLHHIGFLTDNLDREIAYFKNRRVGIWTMGRTGLGAFIYSEPSTVGGIAIEFRTGGPPPKK